jgi:hypothetical protein
VGEARGRVTRMDAPFLAVAVCPDPRDDRTLEDVRALLLDRGAKPDGDRHFIDRHRRMLVQRLVTWDGPEPRPVEIVMSAGPLGDPGYRRHEMVSFGRYVLGLLVTVAERVRPLYGGIGVESVFPTPADLRAGVSAQGTITDPFFVRGDLLAQPDLGPTLAGEFRRATANTAGTVFASWWPFVDGHPAEPGGLPVREPWSRGRVLGRAVMRQARHSS